MTLSAPTNPRFAFFSALLGGSSLFAPGQFPIELDRPLLQVVTGAEERHPVVVAHLAQLLVGLALDPRQEQLERVGRIPQLLQRVWQVHPCLPSGAARPKRNA